MKARARRRIGCTSSNAGFSMLEMMLVIGIIGIIVGTGAMSYVKQINRNRVETAARIINVNFLQARQLAIATRKSHRVAIDVGTLEGFASDTLTGVRTRRASIWIEAKQNQVYDFDVSIPEGGNNRSFVANAYMIGDPDYFPDTVMIADVDNRYPGIDGNPEIFYVEYTARGSVGKVYFSGQEATTNYNAIAPIIHVARDAETFTINGRGYDYSDASGVTIPEEDANERYKVQTIEVIRLTGRTRMYDYAFMNPWPNDELSDE